MLANRVDITAGTPGHRYFVERQWKCLKGEIELIRLCRSAGTPLIVNDSRHGLVNALDAVSHGKFVDEFFAGWIEVHLPRVLAFSLR